MDINKIIEFRKELHKCPEIAHHEVKTQKLIKDFLRANTNVEIVEEDGWFYAKMKGLNPTKTIAFRSDHDAIMNSKNEMFHGCGHDGHTAIMCGTIMALEEDRPLNNVIFLFQPAEENGGGAKLCDKLFKDNTIDEIYGLHNMPNFKKGVAYYRKGCIQCESLGLRIKIDGIQTHASEPEKGLNPSYAISKIIERVKPLSKYIGFKSSKFEDLDFESLVLVTIINLSMGKLNFGVSPKSGEISLTIRAASDKDMKKIIKKIKEMKEDGYSYTYEIYDDFPETNNDVDLCNKTLKVLDKYGVEYMQMSEPIRASEDFGYYKKFCPSLFFMLGTGDGPSIHNENYKFNDDVIEDGIRLFKCIAKG